MTEHPDNDQLPEDEPTGAPLDDENAVEAGSDLLTDEAPEEADAATDLPTDEAAEEADVASHPRDRLDDRGVTDGEFEDREPASPDEVATVGEEFIGGLLEAMGLDAEVSSSVEGESAFVDVTGDGLGILIGRRGQTLDALQEVARTAVQRRLRSRIRLLVDVEGYRARRRKSLADYAKAMALRAKERGTEIELEPMTAYERKIVHDAVGEVEGASSFSEGAEPYRKVVVRGE